MPNLINVLKSSQSQSNGHEKKTQTDEERRAEVLKALKGRNASGRGMEWGTCMVFSCEKDCGTQKDAAGTGSTWREEYVSVPRCLLLPSSLHW